VSCAVPGLSEFYSHVCFKLPTLRVPGAHLSPVAKGGLWWDYLPQTKLQAPPNWNMKHYKSVEFLLNLNVKPPAQTSRPRHKRKRIDDFLATVLAHLQDSKTRNRHDIRAAPQIYFCSCDLRCSRAECILLPCCFDLTTLGLRYSGAGRTPSELDYSYSETFVQTVFAVVNCAVVGLSVFYSLVLTCSLIFLQLWFFVRNVECILHLHFKLERW